MASADEKYDTAFLGILQNEEGHIGKLFDVLFSFLYRRTDFYMDLEKSGGKAGFPPGKAVQLALGAYKKYEKLAIRREKIQRQRFEEERLKAEKLKAQMSEPVMMDTSCNPGVPPVAKVEEVVTSPAPTPPEKPAVIPDAKSAQAEAHAQAKKEPPVKTTSQETAKVATADSVQASGQELTVQEDDSRKGADKENSGKKAGKENTKTDAESKNSETGAAKNTGGADKDHEDGNGDADPEQMRLQKAYQENPESYNGAMLEKYSWSQSITDLDVRVKVPPYVKKGREVKVVIEKKRLKVSHQDDTGQWLPVVEGPLTWDVAREESVWTLIPGDHIHVNLEKIQERWWEALIDGEPKISVREIDASRPMTDLEDEAQAKVEEMMYNDRQKKLGLPGSQQQKVQSMLQKAWDAEGSPFQGQPFDPSKLNISADGSNITFSQ